MKRDTPSEYPPLTLAKTLMSGNEATIKKAMIKKEEKRKYL